MSDPFADAPTDVEATKTPAPKKETVLSEDTQSKIVVTLKGGAGFDAPWIVVHADDPADATAQLSDESLDKLIEATKAAAAKFHDGKAAPARGGASNGKPAGATQAPNGQTPPEGYVFKTGVGKDGRTWKAFMPIDRNSGLDVIWL